MTEPTGNFSGTVEARWKPSGRLLAHPRGHESVSAVAVPFASHTTSSRSRARLGLDLQRQAAFDLAAHWQRESEDGSIEGEAEEKDE
jgi:hypothetical protein